MPTSVEPTAAMSPPAEPDAASATVGAVLPEPGSDSPLAGASRPAGASQPEPQTAQRSSKRSRVRSRIDRRDRPGALTAAIITVVGGLLTASLMWQFNSLGNSIESLGDRIDNLDRSLSTRIDTQSARIDNLDRSLGDRIDTLEAGLRTEMGDLRTEMRTELREINATLLDHTGRLARLEARFEPERSSVVP
ncbi:MAG: hypothetical protein OXB99_16900 [Acidimicrobiaceae bacterium]|nr:hypothetical protein [Acidimicrobiaceae bacterium]